MPRSHSLTGSLARLREGFVDPPPSSEGMPVRISLPLNYEPNYPYPLVVLIHGQGSNEEHVQKVVPHLSRRNYICLSLRGPCDLGQRANGHPSRGWGTPGQYDALIEEYLTQSIYRTCRAFHVHSERIYLTGVCEGASVAYRFGLSHPERFGGVIALNGALPESTPSAPLLRLDNLRHFRVFIGHGFANAVVPLSSARETFRTLYSGGADVRLFTYPTTHRLHPCMLRDVNRWIMDQVNTQIDQLVID